MTENQKKQVDSCREKGLTISATAAKTGLPLGTVKSYCRRKEQEMQPDAVNDGSYTAAYNVNVLPLPKLYAQTVTAQADGEAFVTVMAENLPEHATSFSLILRYDTQVVTPVSVTAGAILPFGENSYLSDSIGSSQGGLLKTVYLGSDDIPQNGELLNLTFHVGAGTIGEHIISWGTCTMEDDTGKTVNISGESIVINVDSSAPATLNASDTTAIVGKVVEIPVYLHGDNVSTLSMDVELDTTIARLVGVTAIEGTASLAGNHIDWSGTSKPGTPFIVLRIGATGIRVSELKYITVDAIRNGAARVHLKGKVRTILLPGKLCQKLLKYARKNKIASGELFVTKSGHSISRKQVWSEMKAVCKQANVDSSKVFPHNLRHLFARVYYRATKDIAKLADMLGHSAIETTRIYLLTTETEHARQLNKLGLIL